MNITLNISNIENLGELTDEKRAGIREIIEALISSGGLTGVKGGKTILHFDGDGVFQGVQLDYFPWRKRRVK